MAGSGGLPGGALVSADARDVCLKNRSLRIWIDLANSPHVLFFRPIIRELEKRGHSVVVTARNFANTLALVRATGIGARRIGGGHDASRNVLLKQVHHFTRTFRLMVFARGRFDVAASHLSYTQAAAAWRLGIPTFGAIDYEHKTLGTFRHTRCLMVPSVIPPAAFEKWGISRRCVRPYDGLKEHVYLEGFRPAVDVRKRLGIGAHQRLVSFRPIADHAEYGNGDGNGVQRGLLEHFAAEKDVCVLILPRTKRQVLELQPLVRELRALRLMRETVDGPSLICASDLLVTGGGTMLREAAVLGVPAVSCFLGPLGAVDRWLAGEGKVIFVRRVEDLQRIRLERRAPQPPPEVNGTVLRQIVQGICDAAEHE